MDTYSKKSPNIMQNLLWETRKIKKMQGNYTIQRIYIAIFLHLSTSIEVL